MKKIIISSLILSLFTLSGCEAEVANNTNTVDTPSDVQGVVSNEAAVQIEVKSADIVSKPNYMSIPLYMSKFSEGSELKIQGIQLDVSGFAKEVVKVTLNKGELLDGWLSSVNFQDAQKSLNIATVGQSPVSAEGHIGDLVLVIESDQTPAMELNISGNVADSNEQFILKPYRITI